VFSSELLNLFPACTTDHISDTNLLVGDRYLKPYIIPVPEVTLVARARNDECLVLASDGLWDVLSNEEVCDAARKRILLWHKKNATSSPSSSAVARGSCDDGGSPDPAAQAAAEYLSKLALQKGSKDNITVLVVDLKVHRRFRSKNLPITTDSSG
jgi:protein phosphatase 2C